MRKVSNGKYASIYTVFLLSTVFPLYIYNVQTGKITELKTDFFQFQEFLFLIADQKVQITQKSLIEKCISITAHHQQQQQEMFFGHILLQIFQGQVKMTIHGTFRQIQLFCNLLGFHTFNIG